MSSRGVRPGFLPREQSQDDQAGHAENKSGCECCNYSVDFQQIQHGLPPSKHADSGVRDQNNPTNEEHAQKNQNREQHVIHAAAIATAVPELNA